MFSLILIEILVFLFITALFFKIAGDGHSSLSKKYRIKLKKHKGFYLQGKSALGWLPVRDRSFAANGVEIKFFLFKEEAEKYAREEIEKMKVKKESEISQKEEKRKTG